MNEKTNPKKKERLVSLDALRGLDMFFLVGISGILQMLPKACDSKLCNWLANQCEHPELLEHPCHSPLHADLKNRVGKRSYVSM